MASETKTHFRIKTGQIEIEYEGPISEVNKRYDKAFDWISSLETEDNLDEGAEASERLDQKGEEKKDNRGGSRKAIYPRYIKKAKEDGFFKTRKSIDDVEAKFRDIGAPVAGKRTAIQNALMNDTKKKDSKLHATKENDTWIYWED